MMLLRALGALAILLSAVPAARAADRTFVSGQGTDSGTCDRQAPCRSFAYAITQTAAGGDIIVLDTAGYGAFQIAQSVNVINQGGTATVTTASGVGILVNAGASDVVRLRGITIIGKGTADTGIRVASVGTIEVADCNIADFRNFGISVNLSAPTKFLSSGTKVSDSPGVGLFVQGPVEGAIVNSAFLRNAANNIVISNGARVSAFKSTASFALSGGGFVANSGAILQLRDIVAAGNQYGLDANGGTILVGHSAISHNISFEIYVRAAGTVQSYGDNEIRSTVFGSLTPLNPR